MVACFFLQLKCTHSIIILGIAVPEYKCLSVDVSFNCRVKNYGIWNNSSLLQAIDDASIKLPEVEYLTNDCKLIEVFLGTFVFALKKFMMKPYRQQNLAADKRTYNSMNICAGIIYGKILGIISKTWSIYLTINNLEPNII